MSEIKESVQKLKTDVVKKDMKLGDGGVCEIPAEVYEKSLEHAGLDLKTAMKYQEHDADLLSATGLALGEVGIGGFKKDKKLDQVSVSFKAGKNVHSHVFQRCKDVPINKPGEPRKLAPKYGILRSSVTVHGADNKGTLRKVREHLNEEATRLLAK